MTAAQAFDRVTRTAMVVVGSFLVLCGIVLVMVAAVPIVIGGLLLGWDFTAERIEK